MNPKRTTALASAVSDSSAPHVTDRLKRASLSLHAASLSRDPLAALFLREQEARDYLGAVHGWAREERDSVALDPAEALRIASEIAERNAR